MLANIPLKGADATAERRELDLQQQLIFEAATRAVVEVAAPARDINYLDVVRDVLLQKGGLRPALFSSVDEVMPLCLERAQALLAIRRGSPIPLFTSEENLNLSQSRIEPVNQTLASEIFTRLHYLRSPRPDSINLGLYVPRASGAGKELIALAAISDCDSADIGALLQLPLGRIKMLSRVVVLSGAPRNSASRLIGRATNWAKRFLEGVDALATYNNPNLAFSGAIYKAANWLFMGFERKKPDFLLDGTYVTLRELKRRFGSFEPAVLEKKLGKRMTLLPEPWFPLEVFAVRFGGT